MKTDLLFLDKMPITRKGKKYRMLLIEEYALIFILVHTRITEKSLDTEKLAFYKDVAIRHCFKSKN